MMRPLITFALTIWALLTLVIGAIRSQPPPALPASLHDGCAAPCWIGIEPGITSSNQAWDRLRALGGFQIPLGCLGKQSVTCTVMRDVRSDPPTIVDLGIEGGWVTQITQYRPGFGLDAILAALGQPDSLRLRMVTARGIRAFTLLVGYQQPRLDVSVTVFCPASYRAVLQADLLWVVLSASDAPILLPLPYDLGDIRRLLSRECSQF